MPDAAAEPDARCPMPSLRLPPHGLEPDPLRPGTLRLLVDGKPYCTLPASSDAIAGVDVGQALDPETAPGSIPRRTRRRPTGRRSAPWSVAPSPAPSWGVACCGEGHPPEAVATAVARAEAAGLLDDAAVRPPLRPDPRGPRPRAGPIAAGPPRRRGRERGHRRAPSRRAGPRTPTPRPLPWPWRANGPRNWARSPGTSSGAGCSATWRAEASAGLSGSKRCVAPWPPPREARERGRQRSVPPAERPILPRGLLYIPHP